MSYVITAGCTGPNGEPLSLAADEGGAIVVADSTELTANFFWSLIYDSTTGNFGMVNMASLETGTPSVLALVDDSGQGSPLTMRPLTAGLNPASTFDVAVGGTALAVRPTLSASLNLTVAGPGPISSGTPVQANDGWNGGQPNEIWTFTQYGVSDFPWFYTFAPECAPGTLLTANPDDANGQLTIEDPSGDDGAASAAQLWGATYWIDANMPVGIVFVNRLLSMAIRTTPGPGPIFCADETTMDSSSAWLVGPGPDPGMTCIRSAAAVDNFFNVSGAGPYQPGNPVITYPWQGGAINEQWAMTLVPSGVTLTL